MLHPLFSFLLNAQSLRQGPPAKTSIPLALLSLLSTVLFLSFPLFSMSACHTSSTGTNATPPAVEIDALKDFYTALTENGPWVDQCGWATSLDMTNMSNPCTWTGVTCGPLYTVGNATFSSVTEIVFSSGSDNNMCGTLPSSIGNLSQLSSFVLYTQPGIRGSLPATIGQWANLKEFDLDTLSIAGTLPQEICQWRNLNKFRLCNTNGIYGTLPSEIGNWGSSFSYFRINYVGMNGPLPLSGPVSMYNWTNLQIFSVTCPFTGPLPNAPVYWKKIVNYILNFHNCSGPVPEGFENLEALDRFSIYSFRSRVTTVPSRILCSKTMTRFIIAGTSDNVDSYGALDACSGMRNLPLQTMWFFSTRQVSQIASDFGSIWPSLTDLWLWHTSIYGTLPNSICGVWNTPSIVRFMTFSDSMLTGPIPSCYFNGSVNLNTLLVNNNFITGPLLLPSELPGLYKYNLQLLSLSGNMMTGSIPSSIGSYPSLENFWIDGNAFSGTLPDFVSPNMNQFCINENNFHGKLPRVPFTGIPVPYNFNIPNFSYVAFNNLFSSSIPSDLVWPGYKVGSILLGNNKLSGPFPLFKAYNSSLIVNGIETNVSKPYLQSFDISSNKISGSIADDFFIYLPSLQSFSSDLNCMEVSIPDSICKATTMNALSINGMSQNCRNGLSFMEIFDSSAGSSGNKGSNGNKGKPTFPSCIWRMPFLQNLSFVGNAMSGSIPANISGSLLNIDGSNNLLDGDIYSFLSYNTSNDYDYNINAYKVQPLPPYYKSIHMKNNLLTNPKVMPHIPKEILQLATDVDFTYNRLSGSMEDTVKNLNEDSSFALLSGNIFSCETMSSIRHLDPGYSSYQCASEILEEYSILFAAVFAFMLLFVLFLKIYARIVKSSDNLAGAIFSIIRSDFIAIFDVKFDGVPVASDVSTIWVNHLRHYIYIYTLALLSSVLLGLPTYKFAFSRKFLDLFEWKHSGIYLTIADGDATGSSRNMAVALYYFWTFTATVVILLMLHNNRTLWDVAKAKSSLTVFNQSLSNLGDTVSASQNPLNSSKEVSESENSRRNENFSEETSITTSRSGSASDVSLVNVSRRKLFSYYLAWILLFIGFLSGCAALNYYYIESQSSDKYSSDVKLSLEYLYAGFKVFLYSVVMEKLFLLFSHVSKSLSYTTLSVMTFLLRATIPLLLVMYFSDNCFFEYFDPEKIEYSVNYRYENTETYLQSNGEYYVTSPVTATHSFSPIFQYSFTCSSFIAKLYIPLFMLSQIIAIVMTCVLYFYIIYCSSDNELVLTSNAKAASVDNNDNDNKSAAQLRRSRSSRCWSVRKCLDLRCCFIDFFIVIRYKYIAPNAMKRGVILSSEEADNLIDFIIKQLMEWKINMLSLVFTSVTFGQISCYFQLILWIYQILQFMYLRCILLRGKDLLSKYQNTLNRSSASVNYMDVFDRKMARLLGPISYIEMFLLLFWVYVFFVIFEVDIVQKMGVWILVPYSAIIVALWYMYLYVVSRYAGARFTDRGTSLTEGGVEL